MFVRYVIKVNKSIFSWPASYPVPLILLLWVTSPFPLWFLRATGARQGPCDTDCPGCSLQPPGCWPYSLLPRTEPGYGGGSWWPWQPSGPMTLAAGSPCSPVGRPGTEAWTCPPGSSCARQWFHREGLPSGCHPPIRDRGNGDVHITHNKTITPLWNWILKQLYFSFFCAALIVFFGSYNILMKNKSEKKCTYLTFICFINLIWFT